MNELSSDVISNHRNTKVLYISYYTHA